MTKSLSVCVIGGRGVLGGPRGVPAQAQDELCITERNLC